MTKEQLGRYGENPHQKSWKEEDEAFKGPSVLAPALHGKPLGYNNLIDAASALEIMIDLQEVPAVAVLKHTNPCGLATGDSLAEAFVNAWYGDEVSAFGSIVGFTKEVDLETAKLLSGKFVEVLVAPAYSPEALEWIKRQKSKEDLRVIATGPIEGAPDFVETREIRGGVLSQTRDNRLYLCDSVKALLDEPQEITEPNSVLTYKVGTVTEQKFGEFREGLVEFGIVAAKHTKSNAIVIVYEYEFQKYRLLGMGAGQPNRLDSVRKLALPKAKENLMRQYFREHGLDYPMTMDRMSHDPEYNSALVDGMRKYERWIMSEQATVLLVSDAFFPKRDAVDAAAEGGIRSIVQPGGSKADQEVIKAANEHSIAMIFTGIRHFKH